MGVRGIHSGGTNFSGRTNVGALRLGVDVGGTNTDAVILTPDGEVLAQAKVPTTPDVVTGIQAVLNRILLDADGLDPSTVGYAMLGTTQCTNAIVERQSLTKTGLIRIGAPASLAVPPLSDWPPDLVAALDGPVAVVEGGFEFDGREIVPLDEDAVARAAHDFRTAQVQAVAICSIFAPVSGAHEERAAHIVRGVLGSNIPVSLSSGIGSVGLLERENATTLNAALAAVARRATEAFQRATAGVGLGHVRCYFAQNDGTLMDLAFARQYPVLTIASGPTNSLRGAAYLSGRARAFVMDVGGTTTDIGVLVDGFPRESSRAVEIGGVRTNFRMPDLLTLGVGGGTVVHGNPAGAPRIGPDSVGYRLTEAAKVYGGAVPTLTDAAHALGYVGFGRGHDSGYDTAAAREVLQATWRMLQDGLDRMRTSAEDLPLIAVGGASFLVPDAFTGVDTVLRPRHSEVANAIGAAMAEASGEVDRIFPLEGRAREEILGRAKEMARANGIRAGADPAQLRVVDVEELPLAYLPASAIRVRVKVAGPLLSAGMEEN